MSEEKFDAIVVGGGLAGLTAATVLARGGAEVMVIERGPFCGSKNMTGGRLYARSLEAVFPGFAASAPVERRITRERFSRLTPSGIEPLAEEDLTAGGALGESYSVLRSGFDRWLAGRAEEEGVMCVDGIAVTDLLVRDGRVCGVVAGDEEMEADVVLLAEGVNGLLAQKLGLRGELTPERTLVGVKDVIELDSAELEKRLGLAPGEGLAWMLFADGMPQCVGDIFLYTNKNSLSLGVLTQVAELEQLELNLSELMEILKQHPVFAPLVEGGRLMEYSAHLVPQGGAGRLESLCSDSVMVLGDAAGLALDLRYMIRGMDFAVESGRLAAEAVLAAKERGDFSKASLSSYQKSLEDSYLMRAMRDFDAPQTAPRDAAAAVARLHEIKLCLEKEA